MKNSKYIFGLITLICLMFVVCIQYFLREKCNWVLLNVLPSFFTAFGLYFLVEMSRRYKKHAIIISLIISLVHEFQRCLLDGIPIDPFDIIAIVLGVMSAVLIKSRFFK